jgi:hypothetical protein
MGWRGTIRAVGAAQRRIEREAVRRQRELERSHRNHQKLLEREQAAYEVDVYNNRLDLLRSIHKECSPELDWRAVRDAPRPAEPVRTRTREAAAQRAMDGYAPSLLDRLFGRAEKKRADLGQAVSDARRLDDADFQGAIIRHRQASADWEESRALAARVLAGDPHAQLEAIEGLAPFAEMTDLGSSVQLAVRPEATIEAVLQVNGDDVIPTETRSLLQSGKLSIKKMPQGQFHELYQDYVCGCALRVARELMALLPVQIVFVTAVGEVLDSATGHVVSRPILSVAVPRRTVDRLNFNDLDPSDSLKNFVHQMSFRKGKGFEPVEQLTPAHLRDSA